MASTEKILEKIGLNEKEIQVYLSCLNLGPSPVRTIALKAEINRGSTYEILKSLIARGLVSYYHQAKHQYFIAEDPSLLTQVVKHKQEELKETEKQLAEALPQLKSIYDKAGAKPVVKYYDGSAGVKAILLDVITAMGKTGEKEYLAYSSSAIKKILYQAYPRFSDDRVTAGVKVKVISIGPGGQMHGLDQRKWLTQKDSAPTYTLIYAGKVAMISIDANKNPLGVIVEDQNIAETQKMIFDFIWEKI